MTHQSPQDIESLLQQYAEDHRAQQVAADRLRKLDRHQRHTRRALLATALMLITGGAASLLLKPHTPFPSSANPRGSVAVCEQAYTRPTTAPLAAQRTHTRANSSILQTTTHPRTPKSTPLKAAITLRATTSQLSPSQTVTPNTQSNTVDTFDVPTTGTIRDDAAPFVQNSSPAAQLLGNQHPEAPRRHALVATVGALAPLGPYGVAAPLLTAGVGLNIALTATPTYGVDIGLSLDGYINTSSAQNAESYPPFHPNFVDHGYTSSSDELYEAIEWYYPSFGLYLTLPFTLHLYPQGRNKAGIQLTLAPGHTLTPVTARASTTTLRGLNPWKLAAGLGLTLPKGFLTSINLTADLLPSYLHGPLEGIHQVGITFAF